MAVRPEDVEAGGLERSVDQIEHVIVGGKASYKNNMLKRTQYDTSVKYENIQGSH
jgi:hypothetical protein